MKLKTACRLVVDAAMCAALLPLMAHALAGERLHEWLGTAMFILFGLHHALNVSWYRNLFRGTYTAMRLVLLATDLLALVVVLVQTGSGFVLSKHLYDFLRFESGMAQARALHMLGAYWGFALMAVHLGLHWNMALGMLGVKGPAGARGKWLAWAAALGLAGYGLHAFLKNDIASYLFWETRFAFIDYEQPLLPFLAEYAAMAVLFAVAGHGLAWLLKRTSGVPRGKASAPGRP